ncbi:hypothetical protein ACFL42_03715 [Candidatus Omnitrophota bacterium]
MTDIHGNYSLQEAALELGVSASWINKVQGRTNIPKPVYKKGAEVKFDLSDIRELKSVYVLRLLGYDFDDIKEIYSLEQKAYNFSKKNKLIKRGDSERLGSPLRLVLYTPRELRLSEAQNFHLSDLRSHLFGGPKATDSRLNKQYQEMGKALLKIYSEINKRAKKIHGFISEAISETSEGASFSREWEV